MQLDMEAIIRDECMAQFYSAVATTPRTTPRKLPRNWKKLASLGGSTKSPAKAEASRKALIRANEVRKQREMERRIDRVAREAGLPPPSLTPEVKNLLPVLK